MFVLQLLAENFLARLTLPKLLGIGFLARFIILMIYLATHEWKGESWEYELMAQSILNGNGFTIRDENVTYHAWIAPVFPFICFVLHLIGGTGPLYLLLYYLFHISLALGIIWLSYRLASEWFGARIAKLSALFIAFEPGLLIYHSYKIDAIALSTFLMLASVILFNSLLRTANLRIAVVFGMTVGLALLTRPDLAILFGLPAVWLVIERQRIRAILKPLGIVLLGSMLIVGPWLLRTYVALDHFVWITSTRGMLLWMGNNPNSVGAPVGLDGRNVWESASDSFKRSVLTATDELQRDAIYREEALRYITEDLGRYARRAIAKFWYFWWFTPTFGREYQQIGTTWKSTYMGFHALMLGLLCFGAWNALRQNRIESRYAATIILLLANSQALLHSLTYVEGRHRILLEPLLLILAAAGLEKVSTWSAFNHTDNNEEALGNTRNGARTSRSLHTISLQTSSASIAVKYTLSLHNKRSPDIHVK